MHSPTHPVDMTKYYQTNVLCAQQLVPFSNLCLVVTTKTSWFRQKHALSYILFIYLLEKKMEGPEGSLGCLVKMQKKTVMKDKQIVLSILVENGKTTFFSYLNDLTKECLQILIIPTTFLILQFVGEGPYLFHVAVSEASSPAFPS